MNDSVRERNLVDPTDISGVAAETVAALKAKLANAPIAEVALELPAFFEANLAVATQPEPSFRMSISGVWLRDGSQVISGHVMSGDCCVGDEIFLSPTNETAQIDRIELVGDGMEITVNSEMSLSAEHQPDALLASHSKQLPILTDVFEAYVFVLPSEMLPEGNDYSLLMGAREVAVTAQEVTRLSDESCKMILRTADILALDEYMASPATGCFLLSRKGEVVGAGIVSMQNYADQRDFVTQQSTNIKRVGHRVPAEERSQRNGHEGAVLWLTGLSGAGKSTLALEVERRMFEAGFQAYVLDGDNLRHGLNSNLGFSPQDRSENIRRVGEVAALFAHGGMIAISAFISPYRADRDRARAAAGGNFHEIHISADVATCEQRDPKDLYKKARAGEIKDFTGISAPYEAPTAPDLIVDTSTGSVEECTDQIMAYIDKHLSVSS